MDIWVDFQTLCFCYHSVRLCTGFSMQFTSFLCKQKRDYHLTFMKGCSSSCISRIDVASSSSRRKSQGLFGILLNCSTFSHRHLLDRQSRIYMRRALCKAQKTYGPALKPMRKRNVMKRFHISLQFMAQAQSSFMDHTHWLKIVQNVSFGFLTFGIYH